MTRDKIITPADWSNLPRVMYVTSVRCIDGVVYEASTTFVPMAIGPEVAYVSLAAIPGLSDVMDGKAVIMPVEIDGKMIAVVKDCDLLNGRESVGQLVLMWPLLLAASPYRKEPTP